MKLNDIGNVNFGFEQAVGYRKQWGELAIVLNVEKTKYVNTLKLVPTIRERVAKFQNKIDKNIQIGFLMIALKTLIVDLVFFNLI